jgi:translation initiation factor IF-3
MAHRELGVELLEKVAEFLGDTAQIDQKPIISGRVVTMLVSPGKTK